jgi:hypothetical protein
MDWFNKLRNNCKKATFLIDKKHLEGIRPLQHIELYIHLAGCSFCRLYDKQSQSIDKLTYEVYQGRAQQTQKLDDAFKNSLQSHIEEQLKNN